MNLGFQQSLLCCIAAAGLWLTLGANADELIETNGKSFVGKVIEETPDTFVFEPEIDGPMRAPRNKFQEVCRTSAPATDSEWKPPGVGTDGYDWVKLKSGEWLRGWLKYVQDKKVEFDSDQLEELTLKLKDVHMLYIAKPSYAKFGREKPVYGMVVISNEVVVVEGPEPVRLPRTELIGITPAGGRASMKYWTGKFNVGLNLRSGNTSSTDLNVNGKLVRRTPNSDFEFRYLGNFAEVEGIRSENNQRFNTSYDIRFGPHWFVRPVNAEYFHDPLANIEAQVTGGIGLGYYFFDNDDLIWKAMAGPAFQYTKFGAVEVGQSSENSTPAAVLYSYFKTDVTTRIKIYLTYQGIGTSTDAGLYTHNSVFTVEFEIKHHLNLDVSWIWDYLQNPHQLSSGETPNHSDFRLTLGLGVRF